MTKARLRARGRSMVQAAPISWTPTIDAASDEPPSPLRRERDGARGGVLDTGVRAGHSGHSSRAIRLGPFGSVLTIDTARALGRLRDMPRKLRVEYEGAIYHVMNRGDRREPVFRDATDRGLFLRTLAEACRKTDWQVPAYCLMSNHFYLVVETPQGNSEQA